MMAGCASLAAAAVVVGAVLLAGDVAALEVNEQFLDVVREYPKGNIAFSVVNRCARPVSVYLLDDGTEPWLVTLNANERYDGGRGNLGQCYAAATHVLLQRFWVHHEAARNVFEITECARADDDVSSCTDDDGCRVFAPQTTPDPQSVWPSRVHTDTVRVQMARLQPPEVRRFTDTGFKTGLRIEDVSPRGWEAVRKFYFEHRDTDAEITEGWTPDNIYVNHWEVPTTVVHVPHDIKQVLWQDLTAYLSEWSGVPAADLVGSSIYGVRRYWRGSYLRNHVDRGDELVLSAILNVDQSDDGEPWVLQIYDHERNAHHVPMRPGDVVLYESAVAIHGRPLPLNSTYYANLFMHTKPRDWPYKGFQYREGV